jgi:hypothetical protein
MITVGFAIARVYLSDYSTSDKPSYGAHGLALLNEMRTWGVVRAGRCRKKF